MAYAKAIFNTETLTIMNMVDPGETISYDWNVDEDFSIVLLEGSIQMHDGTVLTGVNEFRVQPNDFLGATGHGDGRAYFISLFRTDRDVLADQILTEENKTRVRSFAPEWYNDGIPSNPPSSWGSSFSSGNFILTKDEINQQVSVSDWQ